MLTERSPVDSGADKTRRAVVVRGGLCEAVNTHN